MLNVAPKWRWVGRRKAHKQKLPNKRILISGKGRESLERKSWRYAKKVLLGAREIVQGLRHLTCLWPTVVLFSALAYGPPYAP